MQFPPNIVTSAKQKLQALWSDTVTVTRKEKVGNVMKDIVLYADVKCHLSQGSQPVLAQTSTVATTESTFKLYVDTSVAIAEGSTLVIRHKDQTFTGVAGQPFHRNFSNIVPVKVEKIA